MAMSRQLLVTRRKNQSDCREGGKSFWHYRDKDQSEVDVVITRGEETWGVEVKASATTGSSDARGLRRLAEIAGPRFRGGRVL